MSAILQNLSTLAMRQLVDAACKAAGVAAIESGAEAIVSFLSARFCDHSLRLTRALRIANELRLEALEISLAGDSWWQRCQVLLARREEQAFRQQVRAFLDTAPLAGLPGHGKEFCDQCLRDLRAARKAGLLLGGVLEPNELARQAGTFARHADPTRLLEAEWQALEQMAGALRQACFPALADFVALRPAQGTPVLVTAVRYFFRREVEGDRELFQGLAFAQMESLGQAQESGFAALGDALAQHGNRLDELLAEVLEVAVETRDAVLDIRTEQQRQGQQVQDLYDAVLQLKHRYDLAGSEVRPGDSLRIGNDGERQLIKQVLGRFRALPAEQQQRLPALLNSLAQLEVGAGLFDGAQRDFQEVATLVGDRTAQAEAHANAFQAALEQRAWQDALGALQQAASLDPERFAPFPLTKYEPQRILGAGGFGVAFLCRHCNAGSKVVIKSLRLDGLERDVAEVFREAQVLEELDHPGIIRLRDCDYADSARKRPFLVMDYFEGLTLADHVEQHGPLAHDQLLDLAHGVAEALHAAHSRGILHRDVKPANLLVRHDSTRWRVKLIDFGLALKPSMLHASFSTPSSRSRTTVGGSVAGTIDYGAPEQMGRLPGVSVGPYSDVYGFGKTCCYALFKTVQPMRKHWKQVPEELADLLEHCLGETPEERPADFGTVLERLSKLSPRAPARPVEASVAVPVQAAGARLGSSEFWRKVPEAPTPAEPPVGELRRLGVHTAAVYSVAYSPDGRWAVSGSQDGSVRLWEVETGRQVDRFAGHTSTVWSVAFFPDNRRFLTGSEDKSVRLWDGERGRQLACLRDCTYRYAALAVEGGLAVTSSLYDGKLRLWKIEKGEEIRRLSGHTNWVLSLAISPDGKHILSGSKDGTLRLWEAETGRERFCVTGGGSWVLSVAFAPDGGRAVSGSGDSIVRLWQLSNGRELRQLLGHTDWVNSVAYSPDGRRILSGSHDRTVRLWDADTGRELHRFEGHTGSVLSVAVSPDGRYALSGSEDNTLRLWKLPD